MTEVWKIIDEFPNYSVSTFGNVKNNTTEKILSLNIRGGYLCVSLRKGIKQDNNIIKKHKPIHRLVAFAFISNNNKIQNTINHKNHDKLNNNIENLEFATMKEQNIHKRKPCEKIQPVGARKINRIDIKTNKTLETYKSIKDAGLWAKNNNYTKSNNYYISTCVTGKIKSAYGFFWKYADTIENELFDINEEWREIPKYFIDNNKGYEVSNLGKLKNNKGRINYGVVNHNGYLDVRIKKKHYLLHRLVAQTFIPNLENKLFVNHIDGDKLNAKLLNLEWTTGKENSQHAHDNDLCSNRITIVQYDTNMNKIQTFKSMSEASRQLNISRNGIESVCANRNKTAGGFIFKREDDKTEYKPYIKISTHRKKIIQYDLQMNKIASFCSICEAAKQLNISQALISMCCTGKLKKARNFIFKFE
jgi:hypothetical protein